MDGWHLVGGVELEFPFFLLPLSDSFLKDSGRYVGIHSGNFTCVDSRSLKLCQGGSDWYVCILLVWLIILDFWRPSVSVGRVEEFQVGRHRGTINVSSCGRGRNKSELGGVWLVEECANPPEGCAHVWLCHWFWLKPLYLGGGICN